MIDRVPNFSEMEDECQIARPRKSTTGEEDIMELLWQNGQVVMQRSSKKNPYEAAVIAAEQSVMREIRTSGGEEEHQHHQQQQQQNLFMQEDEMASWLQYPLDDSSFDRDFYADLLNSVPPPPPTIAAVAPANQEISPRLQNFAHFSRMTSRPSIAAARESTTVVESNETPAMRQESRVSRLVEDSTAPLNTESGTADDRKRKAATETEDNESRSEDIEFEAAEMKKQARGSAATKRSRAAEVHNLSERRRRDRINEKMKALQELIPRCNKSDKASMLDEAIEYLKSLQMQVQMMSMGCGVIPMMYPGMQQYMPAMGMGMGMGMNQSMVPYPSMVPGSSIPNPAAAAHMGPRYPMPGYQLQPVPVPDPSRAQASNQMNPVMNSHVAQGPNQPQVPNFVDPYQQFYGLHQAQIPLPQNQTVAQPSAYKPGTSNPENQQAS